MPFIQLQRKNMKIAIISDIKSNIYALQAVLSDATHQKVDVIINLGDSFYGPIAPRETYELIRQSQLINICGNEDREILEASLEQLESNALLHYVYNDLKEDVLHWIQELPFEKLIGKEFYLIHGTYFDDSQYLLENVTGKSVQLRDDKKIIELLDDITSQFIFCGHSHLARCINLSSGQVAISPGSVGLQAVKKHLPNEHIIENNTPDASYVLLNIHDSQYNVELKKVPYEYEKAALKAEKNGRDDWAYSLRTGQVLPN